MKRFIFAIVFLVVLSTITSSAAGCFRVQSPAASGLKASLSEAATASSVSADNHPLSASTVFLASTPVIYATVKVNNAPDGTTVGARWVYVKDNSGNTQKQELAEDSKTARGTTYLSFSRQADSGSWAAGEYSISLLVNGVEVSSLPFTVKPVQQADVPAPTISYFKAVPDAISTGQAVTLSWSVNGASQVEISTIGSVAANGNMIVLPVNSMEYQLKATNAAGSTSMKVNITVTSFISDKPELVITGFSVEGDKAYYKIKNIGGVNAKQSTTFLYVEGVKKSSSMVDVLPVGEERQQFFPNYIWTYGSNRTFKLPVRLCADGLNVIGEYDETNNCLSVDW